MKFKKAFSVILAVAMVITLMPSMAFAKTTSSTQNVPTVAADSEMSASTIYMEVEDAAGWTGTTAQKIRLNFKNASWKGDAPSSNETLFGAKKVDEVPGVKAIYTITIYDSIAKDDVITLTNVGVDDASYTVKVDDNNVAVAAALRTKLGASSIYNVTDATDNVITLTAKNTGKITDIPTSSNGKAVVATTNDNGTDYVAPSDEVDAKISLSYLEADKVGTAGATPTPITNAKYITGSKSYVEFEFNPGALAKGSLIIITFEDKALESGSESGPVEVVIDGGDSMVTNSTVSIATVGSGNTVTETNGSVKTYGRTTTEVATNIEIKESAVNSITGDQVIRLDLPKGVTWSDISLDGDMISDSVKNLITTAGNRQDTLEKVTSVNDFLITNDGRTLYFCVGVSNDPNVRQTLVIKSTITIGKEAAKGDIAVDLMGYKARAGKAITDASDLVIANYGDISVEVKTVDEENIPTIYSGYQQTNKDKDTYILVTLKESLPTSLIGGRMIDFELPDGVVVKTNLNVASTSTGAITGSKIDSPYGIKYSLSTSAKLSDASSATAINEALIDFASDTDGSSFSFMVPTASGDTSFLDKAKSVDWNEGKANTLNLFIPVTIRADFEGDVTLNVSSAGAGVVATELVVAKAVSPITVKAEPTKVKLGAQKQQLADITITENVAGYLENGKTIELSLDDLGLANSFSFTKADVAVTSGNLTIDSYKIEKGVITIDIKNASTQASTISITGVDAVLARQLAAGPYALKICGDALIDNGAYDGTYFGHEKGDVCAVTVDGYITVVTPAETDTEDTKIDAQFVIGQSSYTSNGTSADMDAAPYIDGNNRTMVPIRYIANACGVNDDNITWDQATQTAIINGLNTVVRVTMGSYTIKTSSGDIYMDTVAVNNDGRIYVPARYIANALGCEVTWDHATQTVGIVK